jgi:hypothetical protein
VFDNHLELLGIEGPQHLTPGGLIPITLYWRVHGGRGTDYFVRLQAWDYNNISRGTENERFGLIFRYLYPPVMWATDEIVSEARLIRVYDDAPPGGYRFAVSVSTYPGPTPVSVSSTRGQQGEWALVGETAVSRDRFLADLPQPVLPADATLGGQIRLLGVFVTPSLDTHAPDTTMDVRLSWQALTPITESYTLFIHVKDASGNLLAQQDTLPFEGQFPTWAWRVGELVVTEHQLHLPNDAFGPYSLLVGMYRYPSLERLDVTQNGEESPNDIIILEAGGS